jgi:hypothetical protein
MWTGSISSGGSSQCWISSFTFHKSISCLDHLRNYQLFTNDTSPWKQISYFFRFNEVSIWLFTIFRLCFFPWETFCFSWKTLHRGGKRVHSFVLMKYRYICLQFFGSFLSLRNSAFHERLFIVEANRLTLSFWRSVDMIVFNFSTLLSFLEKLSFSRKTLHRGGKSINPFVLMKCRYDCLQFFDSDLLLLWSSSQKNLGHFYGDHCGGVGPVLIIIAVRKYELCAYLSA